MLEAKATFKPLPGCPEGGPREQQRQAYHRPTVKHNACESITVYHLVSGKP